MQLHAWFASWLLCLEDGTCPWHLANVDSEAVSEGQGRCSLKPHHLLPPMAFATHGVTVGLEPSPCAMVLP